MASRNKVCTKDPDFDAGTLSMAFAHGETITFSLADFKSVLPNLALHGLSQKLGDSFAGESDPQEALSKVSELAKRLTAGDWVMRRAKGEASVTLIVQAISVLRDKPIEDVQTIWDNLSEDRQKAVRADPKVKAEITRIRAERDAAKAATSEGDDLTEF